MNINRVLSQTYPEMHTVESLPHPLTGDIYKLLSDSQLMILAQRTLDALVACNIDQIIVSESGAIPFAKICCWLAEKKHLNLQWYAIKIPRNISECFFPTLEAYLSLSLDDLKLTSDFEIEPRGFHYTSNSINQNLIPNDYFLCPYSSLKDILASLVVPLNDVNDSLFLSITQASGLAALLKKPFIFFDEYIDSGKTVYQSFQFFKLFSATLQFQLYAYLIKLPKKDMPDLPCNSLFTLDDGYDAYQWGVYPYENRIDCLGYYYRDSTTVFEKMPLTKLASNLYTSPVSPKKQEIISLLIQIQQLGQQISLETIRKECCIPAVATWLKSYHLSQYILYRLEEMYFGKNACCEFLYQLFDMYGPMWTPLPDNYHLSYLDVFEKKSEFIAVCLLTGSIVEKYQRIRPQFIRHLVHFFETRRIHQQQRLLTTLEKNDEPSL